MTKLGVISVFPSYRRYEDRFRTLLTLGDCVDRHILITMDEPREAQTLSSSRTEVIHFGSAYRGVGFVWQALKAARGVLSSQKSLGFDWIVHDHFLARVGPFAKPLASQRVKTCLSLYFPNFSFWRERGWQVGTNGSLGVAEEWRYRRMVLRRCVLDYVSSSLCDAVIGNSPVIVQDMERLWPRRRAQLFTIPTEVDLSIFYRRGEGPPKIPHSSPGQVTLLYVGSLQPRKGLNVLFEALKECLGRGGNYRLVLVGSPPTLGDRKWLEDLLKRPELRGRVLLGGQVSREELPPFYSSADFLVFPSFYEGSPRVIKEAMACACPVIASDIPGNRLIDPDGQYIHYYKAQDSRALSGLISDASSGSDALHAWGERCQDYIKGFSTEATAARLAGLYRELMGTTS